MNVKLIIAVAFLLILTIVVVILANVYISNRIIKVIVIIASIVTFIALSFLIIYGIRTLNVRRIPIFSASPLARLSAGSQVMEKQKSSRAACNMNIRHVVISPGGATSFNIFIIFISRMQNLMKLIPSSFESIAQELCGCKININDSLNYLNELLDSVYERSIVYIRNYENIFKLLKLIEPAKSEGPLSNRVYALDELGFNLVLLAAANAIRFPDGETYDSIYETLSNTLSIYRSPVVDTQTYYLLSFFKYLEKFRISEALVPSQNNFYFVEAIRYFSDRGEIKFKDKGNKVGSLSQIIALPEKEKPMYVIITFHPEYPGGARGIDSFGMQGYKINSIIFKERYNFSFFAMLSIISDKAVCVITRAGLGRLSRKEPLLCKRQRTLFETIKGIERKYSGIYLLSSDIVAVLYELESGISSLSKEIRSISHIDIGDVNSMMRQKKEEFRDLVIKEFLDEYSNLEANLVYKPEFGDTIIFRVLEFIKLSTGSIESYDSVITDYLFRKGNTEGARIYVALFIERVLNDFFQTKFELAISKKDTQEIWNDITNETDLYASHPPTNAKGSLRDAIENTMTLFTITLHNVFPFNELQERVHHDYILATIYLIKRLWKVYDRCIAVIKLLLEKDTTPDEQKKLLHYLLLKFNKLIYVKCYFASFSNNLASNQTLETKRLELKDSEAYKA